MSDINFSGVNWFRFRFLFILAYFSIQLAFADQSTRERIAVSEINQHYNESNQTFRFGADPHSKV